METSQTQPDSKTAAPNAPAAPPPAPAAPPAPPADTVDWKARAEAAVEAANKAAKDAEATRAELGAIQKSIADGSLISAVLKEKFGAKDAEDPAKTVENFKQKLTASEEKAAQAQKTIKALAVKSALAELAKDAHNPARLPAFIALDDIEVDGVTGVVTNAQVLADRVATLRKTDAYLFGTAPAAPADANRGPPLPTPGRAPPSPPPANAGTPEKPNVPPARQFGVRSAVQRS